MIENLNLIKGKDCHSTSLLSGITEVSVIINEGKFVIEHQILIKYSITMNRSWIERMEKRNGYW